jgi:hypothetical protein
MLDMGEQLQRGVKGNRKRAEHSRHADYALLSLAWPGLAYLSIAMHIGCMCSGYADDACQIFQDDDYLGFKPKS